MSSALGGPWRKPRWRSIGAGALSHWASGMWRPAWSAITRDPRLAKMVATLAGVASVRHATDHISYSEPNCPPTPWHCVIHEGFFSDTREAVGIQVQLDANTVQNKAMLFLPGSHLSAPFGRRHDTSPALDPTRTFGSIFDDVPEWREVDPVAAECDAGSALFWNLALVHGSGSNMTRQVRRYIGTSFIPADATWNGRAGVGLARRRSSSKRVGCSLHLIPKSSGQSPPRVGDPWQRTARTRAPATSP